VTAAHQLALNLSAVRPGFGSNVVYHLHFDGTTLWASTARGLSRSLTAEPYQADEWVTITSDDGFAPGYITAYAVRPGPPDTVWVALASDAWENQAGLEQGEGIYKSTDTGTSWSAVPADRRATGVGNICWDLAVTPQRLWAACWNTYLVEHETGLWFSPDGGTSWEAGVDSTTFGPMAFAVRASGDTVWAGGGSGIGRSTDGGATWRMYRAVPDGLSGDWVTVLGIQEDPGLSSVWASTWPLPGTSQYYSVTRTTDNGGTWRPLSPDLDYDRAYDFAFLDSTVWIATDNGLHASTDWGETWRVLTMQDGLPGDEANTVEVAGDAVWVGTSDGLAWTRDGGDTWEVLLVSDPVGGVDVPVTYAYPNPFSPLREPEGVRIRFALAGEGKVSLTIFNFAEEPVRHLLRGERFPAGTESYTVWDGRDDRDRLVANGAYHYRVWSDIGPGAWGKILVMD
jgi:photosystem II stability/assembly factor-like uncharacterized protein